MCNKAFWKGCLDGIGDFILFGGGAAYIFVSAPSWFLDKSIDQDEQIKELFSRLKDCEEKNVENHELKK